MTADEFCLRLSRDCALPRGGHVLVAVSGGADSMALLCFFCAVRETYPLSVSCAHVEHGIRGGASLQDMAFVRRMCEQMGVPFYGTHVDAPAYARAHGCGLEDAARTLRHAFLQQTAGEIGADCIALAHHRGDQAETVLLHAARGSDVRGLCAMRARSGNLIRPLLKETGASLRAWLMENGQPWREDESNQSEQYARNRIRLRVLPELERAYPGAEGALARLARAAQRDEDYFRRQIDALALRVIPLVNGVALERRQLCGLHEALLSRILVRIMREAGLGTPEAREVDVLMRMLGDGQTAVSLSGGTVARTGKRYLCLTREEAGVPDVPLGEQGVTQTPFGPFFVRDAKPGEMGDGVRCQVISGFRLKGAWVGTRRMGDAMTPFGRHQPVLLKKLIADAGIERAMRASIPVVRSREGILWAVGIRPAQMCHTRQEEENKMVEFGGAWPAQEGAAHRLRTQSQEGAYRGREESDVRGSEG